MHCKPLIIDYVMYALIVCLVLLTCKVCTSIWPPDICIWWLFFTNYYLLAPFLKKLAPKKSLQGPLWPSSKIFWLKHCITYMYLQWSFNLWIKFIWQDTTEIKIIQSTLKSHKPWLQFQIFLLEVYHTSMFQLVQGHFCLYHKQILNTG